MSFVIAYRRSSEIIAIVDLLIDDVLLSRGCFTLRCVRGYVGLDVPFEFNTNTFVVSNQCDGGHTHNQRTIIFLLRRHNLFGVFYCS